MLFNLIVLSFIHLAVLSSRSTIIKKKQTKKTPKKHTTLTAILISHAFSTFAQTMPVKIDRKMHYRKEKNAVKYFWQYRSTFYWGF